MRRDSWRFGFLVREAVHNVFGRGSRLLAVVALAVVAGAGTSAYIALQTQTLLQETQELTLDGRNVLIFSSMSSETVSQIERESCELLAQQHGVNHAGILERVGQADVVPVGVRLPVQRASASLFPELAAADLLIGRMLSDRTTSPFTISVEGTQAAAVLADPHPEDLGTGSSITLPARYSDTIAEKCVVILDKFSDANMAIPVMGAQLTLMESPAAGREMLVATSNPSEDYLQRPDRLLPVVIGGLGAVATAVITRLRGSEVAVYRMSGSSSASVAKLLAIENLLVAGSAALSATVAAIVMSEYYLDLAVPILWGIALASTWALISTLSTLDLSTRNLSNLAKDR